MKFSRRWVFPIYLILLALSWIFMSQRKVPLPVGTEWSGLDLPDAAKGAGADFDALEKLRRLALAEKVAEPEQLKIWQEEPVA